MKCKIPFHVLILALLVFSINVNFAHTAECVKSYFVTIPGVWYTGAQNASYNKTTNTLTYGPTVNSSPSYIIPKRQIGTLKLRSDGTYTADTIQVGTNISGQPQEHVMYQASAFDLVKTYDSPVSIQQIVNDMTSAGIKCETCPTEKAAAIAECGTLANVMMDENICQWECKCVGSIGDYLNHFYFSEGYSPLNPGDAICVGGCRVGIDTVRNDPPYECCLLYTSPSPRDRTRSRMPSSA